MKRCLVVLFLCVLSAVAQSNDGELRLKVTDPSGLGVKCTVELLSEVNQYQNAFTTDADGTLIAKRLAYGIYQDPDPTGGLCSDFRVGGYSLRSSLESRFPAYAGFGFDLGDGQRFRNLDRSLSRGFGESDWLGHDSESSDLAARPLLAGFGELATRLALRRQCGSPPARIGIPDAICGGRDSAHRQPFAGASDRKSKPTTSIPSRFIPPAFPRNLAERWAASLRSIRCGPRSRGFTDKSASFRRQL